jgi:hypothetical protein
MLFYTKLIKPPIFWSSTYYVSCRALSNQPTFATFVATDYLLSPQLRELCSKKCNLLIFSTKIQLLEKLPVATFKSPVATCGEWRQGWTTLMKTNSNSHLSMKISLDNCFTLECFITEISGGWETN